MIEGRTKFSRIIEERKKYSRMIEDTTSVPPIYQYPAEDTYQY